jgi:hypothetical protein
MLALHTKIWSGDDVGMFCYMVAMVMGVWRVGPALGFVFVVVVLGGLEEPEGAEKKPEG